MSTSGTFAQIFRVNENHFVSVCGQFNDHTADFSVYDSMNSCDLANPELILYISQIFKHHPCFQKLIINFKLVEVEAQLDGNCGPNSILNTFLFLAGKNPASIRYMYFQ